MAGPGATLIPFDLTILNPMIINLNYIETTADNKAIKLQRQGGKLLKSLTPQESFATFT
jgi:hypothetical protein